jgi:hypothetical protein
MKELQDELWKWYGKPLTIVLVTTNGMVTAGGRCVMGRGCAAEAKARFPGIDLDLGRKITAGGNVMHPLEAGLIWSFPVKHHWREEADMKLIVRSAHQLAQMAGQRPAWMFVLPRPGCGNGRLDWSDVKPWIAFLPDNVTVVSK